MGMYLHILWKEGLEAQVNRLAQRKKQVQNQCIYIFYKQKDLLEAQANQLAKRKKQVYHQLIP